MQVYEQSEPSAEHLFHLIHERRWLDVADALYRRHRDVSLDPLIERASHVFYDSLGKALDHAPEEVDLEVCEQLFLLRQGRFLSVPDVLFERVVVRLVRAHRERPSAALAYASHFPGNPECAEILAALAAPVRAELRYPGSARVEIQASASEDVSAAIPLLRSAQEETFFHAARDVFPTSLVYPNVALHATLDFDRIRDRLSRQERSFFFRGLVDVVVFDVTARCTPRFFFELDSPLHDDADRRTRDALKDRILAAAGQRLLRVRCREEGITRMDFSDAIRACIADALPH